MSEFENDILRPIPDKEIPYFIDTLRTKHPVTLRVHHFLLMQYKRKEFLKKPENAHLVATSSTRSIFNLFTHRNNRENCTIIGITNEGNRDHVDDYTVFVYSLQEGNDELIEILQQTKKINWKLGPLFLSIEDQHMIPLLDVMSDIGLRFSWLRPNICFWLPKEKALKIEYKVPDDVYLAPLKVEDAKTVDENWYIKSLGTFYYLETEIKLNWGLGVYKKDNDQLVSWILNNEHYAAGTLTTVESEQGKGYGKLVTAAFCKMFAERENVDVITFVRLDNINSQNIFKKLNFERYSNCAWAKLRRVE